MALLQTIAAVRPTDLDDALERLRVAAEAGQPLRLLGGCTDVLVEAHFGKAMPASFLDLSGLRADLGGLAWDDEGLHLGALCTFAEALRDERLRRDLPGLALAASLVGATQIQARGTFAGNVENASPAADAAPMLMALEAQVELLSTEGVRRVPLSAYYTGYRQTQRRPGELIAALVVPASVLGQPGQFFRKVGTRAYQAITKVGIAAYLPRRDGVMVAPRVVAVAMAATIQRCAHIEAALDGKALADIDWPALRQAQVLDLQPIDDVRSTAAYRAEVFARLLRQAVQTSAA